MNRKTNTGKLTFMGVMLALTIIFVMVTAVPGASATIAFFMFIPTIITSIIYGPKLGAAMGFLAGLTTLIRAYTAPLSPFDYFFQNPLIAILPRTFIGVIPYFVYVGINKLFKSGMAENLSVVLAGAFGAITNTVLVVLALYFVYGSKIINDYGLANSIIAFFVGIAGVNGIIEAITAGILTLPVVKIYKKNNV
ncbi:ECF transporter S component [Sedimentibacter sp.]|uniref:ECF transporter S component n=1 Tax=Sedimentibacter sp. TaxID=1960295 RepID=UPI0028A2780E|nr:ECF transporter S component [Sedimentibacter sp.]